MDISKYMLLVSIKVTNCPTSIKLVDKGRGMGLSLLA